MNYSLFTHNSITKTGGRSPNASSRDENSDYYSDAIASSPMVERNSPYLAINNQHQQLTRSKSDKIIRSVKRKNVKLGTSSPTARANRPADSAFPAILNTSSKLLSASVVNLSLFTNDEQSREKSNGTLKMADVPSIQISEDLADNLRKDALFRIPGGDGWDKTEDPKSFEGYKNLSEINADENEDEDKINVRKVKCSGRPETAALTFDFFDKPQKENGNIIAAFNRISDNLFSVKTFLPARGEDKTNSRPIYTINLRD